MDRDDGKQSLNPASLQVADAARLLTRAGGQPVSVEMLEALGAALVDRKDRGRR